MAKHSVLERILERKISDGKWKGLGEGKARQKNLSKALNVVSRCRLRYQNEIRQMGESLLDFPEIEIGYDYKKNLHFMHILED
jgi:hypothetical protein